jgi:hypothetical protein
VLLHDGRWYRGRWSTSTATIAASGAGRSATPPENRAKGCPFLELRPIANTEGARRREDAVPYGEIDPLSYFAAGDISSSG